MGHSYQRIDDCNDDDDRETSQSDTEHCPRTSWKPTLLNILLLAMLLLASTLYVTEKRQGQQLRNHTHSPPSLNAGLRRDTPIPWAPAGKWVNDDPALEDQIWNSPELEFTKGVVAVHDRWALERNISLAQRWPWDTQKGIYLLSSTHDVHCIKSLRRALLNGFDGKSLGITVEHAKHCLSILMQDTLCNADDQLLYTGALHANLGKKFPSAGEGQYRQCRDWSKLRAWAEANSACHHRSPEPGAPLTESFKTCPNGEEPWLSM